ncbi:Uncharacterised protein [Enterobacter cloacae]|nr:Uncharacterised protein [Enterobacter cloacae]
MNGRNELQLQVPMDVRNRRRKSRLYSPVYVVPPFLSDVSLSSPFRMVLVLIFRFVSFYTALWWGKNKTKDNSFPICFTKET